ncbi:MAG: phage tail protein I [Lachnospiraceae bacterium]|nr:phage tail protein I [Lachnospiraceae bacterium]
MIKYRDGEPADLLPPYLRGRPEVMAISYACRMAMAKFLDISVISRMYGDVDSMPEYILDYMATELNAQYYSETMSLEVKRNIIKNAIAWKMKAGTKAAVQELVSVIFGDGEVTEWNEFEGEDGTPGTFDITTSATMTQDSVEQFADLIEKTKNATSHLRYVSARHELETVFAVAANLAQTTEARIINDVNINNPDQAYITEEYIGIYDFAEGADSTVVSSTEEDPTEVTRALSYTCFLATDTEQILVEVRDNETEIFGGPVASAAMTQESISVIGG